MGAIKDQFYYAKKEDDKFVDIIDAHVSALEKKIVDLEARLKAVESK